MALVASPAMRLFSCPKRARQDSNLQVPASLTSGYHARTGRVYQFRYGPTKKPAPGFRRGGSMFFYRCVCDHENEKQAVVICFEHWVFVLGHTPPS